MGTVENQELLALLVATGGDVQIRSVMFAHVHRRCNYSKLETWLLSCGVLTRILSRRDQEREPDAHTNWNWQRTADVFCPTDEE